MPICRISFIHSLKPTIFKENNYTFQYPRRKRIFGDRALSIFIKAPSVEELRRRLQGRGTDSPEAIERRVAKAESETVFAEGKFDYVLVNDDLQKALAEAEKVVAGFIEG